MALTYRVVCVQVIAIVAIAVLLLSVGLDQALGATWTGAACVVPNLYFAWRVEGTSRAADASRLLRGSISRFVTIGLLLVGVIVVTQPPALGFVAGLLAAQFAQVFASMTLQ